MPNEATRAGDANRITREYFDSLLIEMRHMGAVLPETDVTIYGETFPTPIMTAALSHLDNQCPNGAVEMARGAKAAGAINWTGMGGESELEALAATGARIIKIIKPYADNDTIFRKIAHAEKVGALAVGMDLDHTFNRRGECDTVLGERMLPKSLKEIESFVRSTKLPFIIKGVLGARDALICRDLGVRGVVVSHHHGILDYALPPLMALPEIVEAVGKDMPVFVDCGLETGIDAFKALALGATAVSVGRALMEKLKEGGANAVTGKIAQMTEELAGAMARTCSPRVDRIDPGVIRRR
jgi:isopentenyl diphosphate isomerase/L-lactate dehydrogenase-like FMN-dependent dehydrogenase